jgi:hypothetical protein
MLEVMEKGTPRWCPDCDAPVGPYPGVGLREKRCVACAKARDLEQARARYDPDVRHRKHQRVRARNAGAVALRREAWKAAGEAKRLAREHAALIVRNDALVGGCVECGETDPLVLQFDHVRGVKSRNVTPTMSLDDLREEIEKCDVRCANCHTRRHRLAAHKLGV